MPLTEKERRYKTVTVKVEHEGVAYTMMFNRFDQIMHPRLKKQRRTTTCTLSFRKVGLATDTCVTDTAYLKPGERFDAVEGQKQALRHVLKQCGALLGGKASQAVWNAWAQHAGLIKAKPAKKLTVSRAAAIGAPEPLAATA